MIGNKNQVMYHVTRTDNRNSILSEGLNGTVYPSPWEGEYPPEELPAGTYLWENPEDAEEYVHTVAGNWGDYNEEYDIWAVDVNSLTLRDDPQRSGDAASHYVTESITTDGIRLMDTVKSQSWEDRYG